MPRAAAVWITFYAGARILDCSPACGHIGNDGNAHPRFRVGDLSATASARFDVRARSYEVAANGATAAVGFPELDYTGTHPAQLFLDFGVPSAGNYDWSTVPVSTSNTLASEWTEIVPPNTGSLPPALGFQRFAVTGAREAVGVNHTAEANDSNLTLLAGVLFAAAQEALHD